MTTVADFYNALEGAAGLSDSARIEYFVYYLTEVAGGSGATARDVSQCFSDCDLGVPGSVGPTLSKGLASKPRKYVKVASGGYRLERHRRDELKAKIGAPTPVADIPHELRDLLGKLPEGAGKEWLREALDCFNVKAYRATLVMVWIYALDHLFDYIIAHKLAEFNAALAAHPDQKTAKKVGAIAVRDDFGGLGEEMFLDLAKTAKVITADVRRILGVALGTRNSAAHPSGVLITRAKVATIAEDLLHNVILKYPV